MNSTRFGNGSTAIHLSPAAFLVDNCGNIYVSGWGANILQGTPLSGMPVTSDAFQFNSPNGYDFYLFVLKGDFSQLLYGTYIGGAQAAEHVDGGTSRFDKNGVVYQSVCGGCGGSSDFPTTPGAWSSQNNSSNCNNVVYKFSTGLIPVADFIPDQTAGCADFTVQFQNFSTDDDTYLWDFGNGNLDSTTFEPSITFTESGNYTVNLYVTDSVCLLTDTAEINITVYPAVILNVDSVINVCSSTPVTLTADTDGTADTFIWSTSSSFTNPLNSPSDSTITVSSAGTYYIQVSNPQCSKIDTVIINYQLPPTISLSVTGNEGCAPFSSSFQATTANSDSLVWNFGGLSTISTASTVNSQNFNFTTPGNYQVSVTAINECPNSVNASVSVNILEPIDITTLTPIFICNNDPYTMMATITGQPTSVIWSDQPDYSNQLNTGPADYDIVVNTSGTYYIQATNGFCSDTASATITFDSPSQASFIPNQPAGCGPLTVSFNNTSVQTQSFAWDFGNGQIDSVNFEPTVTYSNPGQYQVSLSIFDPDCPAADTAFFTIEVFPTVVLTLQDSISLCDTIPISISPSNVGSADYFVWSSNNLFSDTLNVDTTSAQLDLSNPSAGYYYLSASNGFCNNLDSVVINFVQLDIDLIANDSICSGELATVSVINLIPSTNLVYVWAPDSIIVSNQVNSIQVNPTLSQTIFVTATGSGCNVSDSIFVNVSTLDSTIVLASASDYLVSPGTTVTLFGSPSGLDSYSWSPIDGLSDPAMQQTNAEVNETTIYTLTVSDGACTRSDTTEVKVYEIICEDPYVFIPNAFSPNGDNENDVLYVRGIWIEKMIFRIFDRWGEIVFESTEPTIGWDGTFRGKKLDPDVYDFYLDVTCVGGLKSISKGNVTLMK
jgi:gliding motility-associated-like protein